MSDRRPVLSVVTTGARLVHDLQRSLSELQLRDVHEQLDLHLSTEPIPYRLPTLIEFAEDQRGARR